ncbi:MAG TPA: ThiF family adenylyltransferase [Phycisphaerae bacterium]|nr:ThiF family adenylyltransferase [Phycisphaerae bacterium]
MPKKETPSRMSRARVRNPPTLEDCRIVVVDLNALGYRIAQLLVSAGVQSLRLIDRRLVTKRHQLREGYDTIDVGRLKAHAAVQRCHDINPCVDISGSRKRSNRDLSSANVVINCSSISRQGRSQSGPVSRVTILFNTERRSSIRIEYDRAARQAADTVTTPEPLSPAETAIIAGIAVRLAVRFASGEVIRRSKRFQIDGLTVRVTAGWPRKE